MFYPKLSNRPLLKYGWTIFSFVDLGWTHSISLWHFHFQSMLMKLPWYRRTHQYWFVGYHNDQGNLLSENLKCTILIFDALRVHTFWLSTWWCFKKKSFFTGSCHRKWSMSGGKVAYKWAEFEMCIQFCRSKGAEYSLEEVMPSASAFLGDASMKYVRMTTCVAYSSLAVSAAGIALRCLSI